MFSFAADPGGIGSAFHRAEEAGKRKTLSTTGIWY